MALKKIIKYAVIAFLAVALILGTQLIASELNKWLFGNPAERIIADLKKKLEDEIAVLEKRNQEIIKRQQEIIGRIEQLQRELQSIQREVRKLEREIENVYTDISTVDRALQVIAGHQLDSTKTQ
jgi:septal ring factor EnvC (AmiA/AmiB activator)